MLLKPLTKAVALGNVEAAVRFAGHLMEIGGTVDHLEDRKIHFVLRALEGATPALKTEFTAKLLAVHGAAMSEASRQRFSAILDRL